MKLGIALPYNISRQASKLAKLAEDAGWDGIFLGDAVWTEDPMITLAAAACSTSRIRLGTMITPVPLRRPWKLASESLALDRLSEGRLTLGLAAGAVWMGWQGFPDEVTETRLRVEMLDETIDLLTLFYKCKPFDYEGKHYHLKLTQVDEMYYPGKPVQQPRIPLWVVGIWPMEKSMQRTLKGDGVIVEARSPDGSSADVTPQHVSEIKAYVRANRSIKTPFDIVINGSTKDLDEAHARERLLAWQEAGATWWIQGMWEETVESVEKYIYKGPAVLQ
jgi:hypothetical protein